MRIMLHGGERDGEVLNDVPWPPGEFDDYTLAGVQDGVMHYAWKGTRVCLT